MLGNELLYKMGYKLALKENHNQIEITYNSPLGVNIAKLTIFNNGSVIFHSTLTKEDLKELESKEVEILTETYNLVESI